MSIDRLRYAAAVLLCITAGAVGSQLVKAGLWPYAVALGLVVALVTALEVIPRVSSPRRSTSR